MLYAAGQILVIHSRVRSVLLFIIADLFYWAGGGTWNATPSELKNFISFLFFNSTSLRMYILSSCHRNSYHHVKDHF